MNIKDFEKQREVRVWLEGNSGDYGPGNPFYEMRTGFRRKIVGFLNRNPSTLLDLEDLPVNEQESVQNVVQALKEARMLKVIDTAGEKPVYAPSFAILSSDDRELLYPLILDAAKSYAAVILEKEDQLDKNLLEAGFDLQSRVPVFIAFIRDELFFQYMKKLELFPTGSGQCPKNGSGFVYGVEPHDTSLKWRLNITHSISSTFSFIYISPYFSSNDLFKQWGYHHTGEATGDFQEILNQLELDTATAMEDIRVKLSERNFQKYMPSILDYLESQMAISRKNGGYVRTTPIITKQFWEKLKTIADSASRTISSFLQSQELEKLYYQTCSGRNGISRAEFREVTGWITVWTSVAILEEKRFFPDLSETGRELFVYDKSEINGL